MAKLRKGVSYRNLERPYTRRSKFRKLNFIRATPNNKIVKYVMGSPKTEFKHKLRLISDDALQIRHNAIESARQTANRLLEGKLRKSFYCFKILIYPHHILRENPIASGAGADRLSTGMKNSFGKAIGLAAQIREGQILLEVSANNESVARLALKRAAHKLPCKSKIVEV